MQDEINPALDGPIAILDADNKQVGPRYDEAVEARKVLRTLPEGTYHIVRYLNEGIVIRPPKPIEVNMVELGRTYIKRAPKAG